MFLSHSREVFVALYNAGLLSSGAVRWDKPGVHLFIVWAVGVLQSTGVEYCSTHKATQGIWTYKHADGRVHVLIWK